MPQIVKICKTKCYTNAAQDRLMPEDDPEAASLVAIPGQRVHDARIQRYSNHEEYFEEANTDPAPRVHPDIEGQTVPAAPIMSRTSVVASETEQPEKPTGSQPSASELVKVDRVPEPEKKQPEKGNKRK